MNNGDRFSLEIDFWDDDTVGAFEPEKVIRRLRSAFSDAEVDGIDCQRARLLWELENWERQEPDAERRRPLVKSSWYLYQTCGPTYRFVVPFPSGQRVVGTASRLAVEFWVPTDLPTEGRDRLLAFLASLQMGTPSVGIETGLGGPAVNAPWLRELRAGE